MYNQVPFKIALYVIVSSSIKVKSGEIQYM